MSGNLQRRGRRRFALPLHLERRVLLSNSWIPAAGMQPKIDVSTPAIPAPKDLATPQLVTAARGLPIADQLVVSARQGNVLDLISPTGPLAGLQLERRLDTTTAVFRLPLVSPSTMGPVPSGALREAWQSRAAAGQYAASLPQVAWTSPVLETSGASQWMVPTNEVIVAMKPGQRAADFFSKDTRFASYRPLPGTTDQFVAQVASGGGDEALLLAEALRSDSRLAWVEANAFRDIRKFATPNDPLFNLQWHLENNGIAGGTVDADVDASAAWDITTGTSQTVIAVVDDGMEFSHPDLAPNLFVNTGEIAGNGIDDDNNGYIDDRNGWDFTTNGTLGDNNPGADSVNDAHATAVAGVAAGSGNNGIGVTGMAPNARILPVRMFGSTGSATTDANIASAIYYAAGRTRDGLGQWTDVHVMNNSWGGGGVSTAITAAFTWAAGSARGGLGTAVLIASGNDFSSSVSFPSTLAATIPGVMAVGATTNFDTRATYSNYGSALSFVAPTSGITYGGTADVVTVDRVGTNGYNWSNTWAGSGSNDYTDSFGGTSSATPLSAGIAALVLSRATDLGISLTAAQVRGLLRNTTDLVGPAGISYNDATGFNLEYGTGRVNAASALRGVGIAELGVFQGRTAVANGATLNLGSLRVGNSLTRTFRLRNEGTSPLNLSGLSISGGADFTISSGLGSGTLAVGESTTFTVQFAPTVGGAQSAAITLTSSDADEGTYTINLNATATTVSITGRLFEDWNGDQIQESYDPNVVGRTVFIDTNNNGLLDGNLRIVSSGTINLAIPDGNATGTSTALTVSGLTGTVDDVEVTLNITHTWVSDLRLSLQGPNGVTVSLVNARGGSGDNFTNTTFDDQAATAISAGTAPFTGRFRPEIPLSNFNGINPNGNWTLILADTVTTDAGILRDWSVRVSAFDPVGGGEPTALTDANGVYVFEGLPAGDQTVRIDPLSGWITPPPLVVNRPTGDTMIVNANFPLTRADAVYSRVYTDTNGNGNTDSDESGLSGRVVFLDVNGNGLLDPVTGLTTVSSGTLNQSIPDNNTTGISSNLVVAGLGGGIVDLDVTLNVAHTATGNLLVRLTSPQGTTINLVNQRGGTGDNFTGLILDDQAATAVTAGTAPFTGRFRPETPLTGFNGFSPNGTWTLNISDRASLNLGTLQNWSLTFTTGERSQTSDSSGRVRLDNVGSGTQVVRQVVPRGVQLTSPPGGSSTETLTAGGVVHAPHFGNQDIPGSTLIGSLYEDWYGDLQRQSFDPVVAVPQTLYVDGNNNGIFDGPVVTNFNSEAINATIPDNNSSGVSHNIVVSGLVGTISDLDVTLNVTHTNVGDLRVQLRGPNNFSINLVERRGGTGDHFTATILDDQATTAIGSGAAPFTGRFRPEVPLSNFHGLDPNGTWTLTISDLSLGTTGTLDSWSLGVQTTSAAAEQSFTTDSMGMYSFVALPAGPTAVRVTPSAGWNSLNSISLNLPATPTALTGADLALARQNSVYSRVFNDVNGDAVAGATEPGLAGRTVTLDANGNGQIDIRNLSVPSGTLNLAVPDSNITGVNSNLAVSGAIGSIIDLDVSINMTHTWIGDMVITLTSPTGTKITLFNQRGGSGDNLTNTVFDDQATTAISTGTAPFNGRFRPENPLSNFTGQQPNGTWTLNLSDRAGGDLGTLLNWKLDFVLAEDPTASSDANGLVRFDNVTPGTTSIRQVQQQGWRFTTPPGGAGSQTLVAGGSSFAPIFGNFADPIAPQVVSITRNSPNPTNAASVDWTVTFSETVTGLSLSNFSLATSGLTGAGLTTLTGSGSVYTVSASTGTGDGTLGLNLTSAANVIDLALNPLVLVPTTSSGSIDLAIPDGAGVFVAAPLSLSGLVGAVADVEVTVNITHTWVGDVQLALLGPNGVSVPLVTNRGSSGDNFTNTTFDDQATVAISAGAAPFTGRFRPELPLSTFNGINPNGTWTLLAADTILTDVGVVQNWALRVETTQPSVIGEVYTIDKTAPSVLEYRVVYGNGLTFNLLGSTRSILPWQITGIQVLFSEPIGTASLGSLGGVAATDLTGLGTTLLTWTVSPVTQGTLNTVLRASGLNFIADTASNRLSAGTDFTRTLRILWGDFTGDGVVNAADLSGVSNRTALPYNLFADINGDGVVDATDVALVRQRLGRRL
jgi:subtilisin-like proprotein convertase family protein/subtilisin family serine protease